MELHVVVDGDSMLQLMQLHKAPLLHYLLEISCMRMKESLLSSLERLLLSLLVGASLKLQAELLGKAEPEP